MVAQAPPRAPNNLQDRLVEMLIGWQHAVQRALF
jgi:hypothetical protein